MGFIDIDFRILPGRVVYFADRRLVLAILRDTYTAVLPKSVYILPCSLIQIPTISYLFLASLTCTY